MQRFFRAEHERAELVYIASVANLEIDDIFRTILEHLDYRVEVQKVRSTDGGVGVGIDLKIVKADVKMNGSETSTSQLIVTSPTDTRMNQIITAADLTVVLDEMHKASPALRESLVDWIKATRAEPEGLTLVLVGTSTDAGRLVALDTGIDRYVKEMSVDLMTLEEGRYIVDEGFARLGLQITPELRERVVGAAAGAPTIIQSLCLDAAESVIQDGRDEVEAGDLQAAVDLYLKEHGGRLAEYYWRAIETTGPKRYRKQVLMAMAMIPSDCATMDDIRRGVSESLGEEVPSTTLSGPLRELKTEQYGKVLRDVDRPISGQRIHNLTAFSDPMMKSFVRFMNNLGQNGLEAPKG
ncbi:hypothetical protein BIV01_01590 [Curtobacterium sp. MCBA15_013]|nr:hypothetical protein BIV01_01590 [Curtobacterium sp. MCBA15_013]